MNIDFKVYKSRNCFFEDMCVPILPGVPEDFNAYENGYNEEVYAPPEIMTFVLPEKYTIKASNDNLYRVYSPDNKDCTFRWDRNRVRVDYIFGPSLFLLKKVGRPSGSGRTPLTVRVNLNVSEEAASKLDLLMAENKGMSKSQIINDLILEADIQQSVD